MGGEEGADLAIVAGGDDEDGDIGVVAAFLRVAMPGDIGGDCDAWEEFGVSFGGFNFGDVIGERSPDVDIVAVIS